MIIRYLPLLTSLLFVIINADENKDQRSAINIAVAEHQPNDILTNDSFDQITAEKILLRVPRNPEKLNRQRRQYYDTDEIWGMAKKVFITVVVLVSLCIICCIGTTVFMCVKCCCGNSNRKRNQAFTPVPQPIIIHTNSPYYQPQPQFQSQQQQVPSPPTQSWGIENRPMLPQPSAPPLPNDDYRMDRPPSYSKACAGV